MAYGEADKVRELAGSPPNDEVPPDQIQGAIDDGDKLLDMETGRTWSSGDSEYSVVQRAVNYYAASIILDQFNDPADKAKWFIERFKSVIDSLKRSSQVATPAEHTFLKSSRPEEA